MKSIIVFVLCISATFTAAFKFPTSVPDDSCDCRPLSRCLTVLSQIKSIHQRDSVRHKAFTKYLDVINCGYERREPQVCCPDQIPGEVLKIVNNKKYWTKWEEQASIKRLKNAVAKAKCSSLPTLTENHPVELPKYQDQFPDCGRDLWREDFYGNRTIIGEYPWLALLEYDTPQDGKKFLCGGALISDKHILTAARCVTSLGNKLTSVILGEYDTNANPECMLDSVDNDLICVNSATRYSIERSIIHNEYNDGISHREIDDDFGADLHDIAIIKLKENVQFNDYVQPICLPSKKPKTRRFKVSGWGRSFVPDNKGFNHKLLSYLTQCRYSDTQRRELEQIYDKNEHICAGDSRRDEQPCIVDSGGPLMAFERKKDGIGRMTVFGVSFMEMTCENHGQPMNLPGIFTNVYNYKDWILENMNL